MSSSVIVWNRVAAVACSAAPPPVHWWRKLDPSSLSVTSGDSRSAGRSISASCPRLVAAAAQPARACACCSSASSYNVWLPFGAGASLPRCNNFLPRGVLFFRVCLRACRVCCRTGVSISVPLGCFASLAALLSVQYNYIARLSVQYNNIARCQGGEAPERYRYCTSWLSCSEQPGTGTGGYCTLREGGDWLDPWQRGLSMR